jgi:glycosyltransferase involved in cell wall biosynthesis
MLQIIHLAENGGAEKHTRLITKAFRKAGFDIVFVYQPGPYASQFATLGEQGVECIEFDLKKNLLASVFFIRKVIRTRNVKYVHSHMHGADLIAMLACLGRREICHFSTIHCLPWHNDQASLLQRLEYYLMTLIPFHVMTRVFAVSQAAKDEACRALFLPKKKVSVTLNSIDFSEMETDPRGVKYLRPRLLGKFHGTVLLSTGELCARKGQLHVLKAFNLFRRPIEDVKLVFLGEGEKKKELMILAENYGLRDCVLFPGFQPNITDWLAIADIYLQMSLIDPLPRALLEAMYLGLPVIVSDIDTMRDVVRDNETGLVVKPTEPSQIKRAIETLISDPELAKKLGAAGSAFVKNNCSMDGMAVKIMAGLPKKFRRNQAGASCVL